MRRSYAALLLMAAAAAVVLVVDVSTRGDAHDATLEASEALGDTLSSVVQKRNLARFMAKQDALLDKQARSAVDDKPKKSHKTHTDKHSAMGMGVEGDSTLYEQVQARNLREQMEEEDKANGVSPMELIQMHGINDDLGLSLTRVVQQRNIHHMMMEQEKELKKSATHESKAKAKVEKKPELDDASTMMPGRMYEAVQARNLRNQLDDDQKDFEGMNEDLVAADFAHRYCTPASPKNACGRCESDHHCGKKGGLCSDGKNPFCHRHPFRHAFEKKSSKTGLSSMPKITSGHHRHEMLNNVWANAFDRKKKHTSKKDIAKSSILSDDFN